MTRVRRSGELDPRTIKVHLSEDVRRALSDLGGALYGSEQVSDDVLSIIRDLGARKPWTVYEILAAWHVIAEPVFEHIQATGDRRVLKAWHDIGSNLLDDSLTITTSRTRGER
jgi:hypothetical protein